MFSIFFYGIFASKSIHFYPMPDTHTKKGKKYLRSIIQYDTRFDMVQRILHCYSGMLIAQGKKGIKDRHINILACYILYGVSQDTMHKYGNLFNVSVGYQRVLNTELRKNNYLVKSDPFSEQYKLSLELDSLREFFVSNYDEESMVLSIVFKRKPNEHRPT